jgi:hypothetical protein
MLVSGIIDLAAKRLDLDVDDYYTEVMILNINAAIARINNGLIKANDPEVIKQMTITGTITKPSDFFAFIPQKANYPLICEGNQIRMAYGAPPSVVFKYSTFKPLLTTVADTIPLPDYCISEIVDYVCIHINNDFEANVQQDVGLATSDETLLFSAKGGA